MRTWGQMFADMAEGGDAGEGGYERACSLSELQAAGRKRVTVQGRIVALFHVSGQVYALDHFCYHAGGPLELGDIEDSHGRLCVVCPWHRHSITLDTGESLYTSINPANPKEKKYNSLKGS
ncbi:Rieske domain-containing protein [Geodia barretti]|uniref:Rieske domain-containing protein n=1 Tax=Geodia barretti TaxID=519541 RepID=A0AA35SD40_GEOBA|nr:Rieske domain-containing protein [Geodia barretti]